MTSRWKYIVIWDLSKHDLSKNVPRRQKQQLSRQNFYDRISNHWYIQKQFEKHPKHKTFLPCQCISSFEWVKADF